MARRQAIGIGDRLIYWRERRAVTQVELADRLGLNPSSVCKWEKGVQKPTAENLEHIAKALNISLADFFGEPEANAI